jgi:hypothetical protein
MWGTLPGKISQKFFEVLFKVTIRTVDLAEWTLKKTEIVTPKVTNFVGL